MTQTARSKWVLFLATINALFALAVGGLVVHALRAAPAAPQPLSCPVAREPDPQLTQTLQLLAAEQQTLVLRALQPQPQAAAPMRSARRPARRARPLRPVCRR